jgi:hypothetical protein
MGEFDSMDEYVAGIRPSPGWTVEEGRRDLLALYRSHASRPGEAIIDKGPNTNLLRADFLARCFPEAAWLVIYRDPVSTVEGFRRKWPLFGHESAEANARFWADAYQCCLAQLDALGRRVTIVDYSSLAAGMDEVFAKLGRELGLEPATGRRRLRSVVNIEGFGIRNVSHSRIGVVGDADARSLARVCDEDARVIRGVSDSVRSALEQRSSTRDLGFAS